MISMSKQLQSGGTDLDIKFIKTYFKEKTSYDEQQVLEANNFDCEQRQAPLKTFFKLDRDDYSFPRHCSKIRKTLPREQANGLIKKVMDVNEFTEAKITS